VHSASILTVYLKGFLVALYCCHSAMFTGYAGRERRRVDLSGRKIEIGNRAQNVGALINRL
jgi:hypothetical protein